MEKTITIYTIEKEDGTTEEVKAKFASRGSTPMRYNMQFGSDFFIDLMKLEALEKLSQNPTYEELKGLNMDVIYNITWALAKTADPTIPEPLEWLDQFEQFPLMEIVPDINELIRHSLGTKKK